MSTMPDFSYMDEWSDDRIAEFKAATRAASVRPAAASLRPFALSRPAADPLVGVQLAEALPGSPADRAGPVLAEGDSWFDFPPEPDVINCLQDLGYRIENHARRGDTLENMIYGTGYDRSWNRTPPTIDTVLRRLGEMRPKVFLFSGGGNDVAGDEFGSFLNHAGTGLPPLRAGYVDYMIDTVFRTCVESLINQVRAASPDTTIIMHGYADAVPSGRGTRYILPWYEWAGPWLRPALSAKGIVVPALQRSTVKTLITRFNAMLAGLAAAHPNFRHVDVRAAATGDGDWSDELHLKGRAFARVAHLIDAVIRTVV